MRTLAASISFIFILGLLLSAKLYAQSGPGGYGVTDGSSNLVLWLRADQGVTTSGTDVTGWSDLSGYANDVAFINGTPNLIGADVNFNSQPSINFEPGPDEYMRVDDDNSLDDSSEMSIFYVFRPDNSTGVRAHLSKRVSNGNNQSYVFYENGSINSRFNSNNDVGSGITAANVYINAATLQTGSFNHWLNQNEGGGTSTGTVANNTSDLFIGNFDASDGRTFDGRMVEIIIFREYLTNAQRIAVETYLASKYGISAVTDDFWDEATYSTYDMELAGIGQDALDGTVADSATSAVLSISGGSGRASGEWLFWAHDGGDFSAYGTFDGVSNRLEREWAVNETGELLDVLVSIPESSLPSTGLAAPAFNLLVDTDGDADFSNATAYPMTLSSGNYEVTLDLDDDDRLAISYDPPIPAGVTGTLAFWFSAGTGVENGGSPATDGQSVTVWQDLSSANADGTDQGTPPTYVEANTLNFRPLVRFDGTDDYLDFDLTGLENDNYQIFTVVQREAGGTQYILGSELNTGSDALLYGYSNNTTAYLQNEDASPVTTAIPDFNFPVESPAIGVASYTGSTLSIGEFRDGSSSTTTFATSTDYGATSYQGNLGRAISGNYFTGDVGEIIAFDATLLSAQDSAAVISNLAISYGVSLNADYADEGGTTLFDYATVSGDGFGNDITAIGFDESFSLEQNVSKSTTDSIVLSTSVDFSSLNSNASRPSLSDGQFTFISNDDDPYNLDQPFNGIINSRLDRSWRVDEVGAPGSVIIAIPTSIATINFMLVSDDPTFATNIEQVSVVQSGGYYYATHDFSSGDYFTFGFDDTEIWYSYKTGVWSDWTNWTLDGSVSALLNNPLMKIPLPGDSVVIKPGKRITVDIDDVVVESMEINGILDIVNTSGHDFTTILGFGRLELAGDIGGIGNYPDGDDTRFYDVDEGGTVFIYGPGFEIDQKRNYRNLILSLDDPSDVVTFTSDSISITKDFTLTQGGFQFNDAVSTTPSVLTVNGNVLVEPNGSFLTGAGDARHEFDLFGDFVNQGFVQFTSSGALDQNTLDPAYGIVDLNFRSGDQDQSLTLQNTALLYRIEIDKGVDDTYLLDITSDPGFFNLYGYSNQSHGANAQLSSALDQNINALGLYFGTVRLGENVDVPRLNGGGNYNISAGAQLWIDGGATRKTGGTAIVPYGTIRVSSGTLDAPINSGITSRGSATLIIEGGTVTIRQFRTSVFGDTNQGGIVQSGGVLNITGGSIAGGYYPLNLTYEGNVFNMSGGVMNVSGANGQGGIFINSDPENVSVTGGTINVTVNNNNDFIITSRSNFYNLTMARSSGTGQVILNGGSTGSGGANQRTLPALPLSVTNDFSLLGTSTVFDANGEDVSITGTMTLALGTSMVMNNNTLTFDGLGTSFIDIQTTGTLNLDSLVIDKDLDTDLVRVTNGPDRPITIANYFNHNSGQFDYLEDTIVLNGDLMLSDTIGLDTSTGELLLAGSSAQSITSASGVIYDLVIDNANGVSLDQDIVVDSLVLDGGIFAIGTAGLAITSDLSSNTGFSSSLMVETAGNLSDGGITLAINADGVYDYPFGVPGKFTPAVADLSLSSGQAGNIRMRPADEVLTTTNLSVSGVLNYYWSVTPLGFGADLPTINSYVFTYDPADVVSGPASNFVSGYVDDGLPYNRNFEGAAGVQVSTTPDEITFGGLPAGDAGPGPGPGFTAISANYTAGVSGRFIGNPEIYYTRDAYFTTAPGVCANNCTISGPQSGCSGQDFDFVSSDWNGPANGGNGGSTGPRFVLWSLTGHNGTPHTSAPGPGDVLIINDCGRIRVRDVALTIAAVENDGTFAFEARTNQNAYNGSVLGELTGDGTMFFDFFNGGTSPTNLPDADYGNLSSGFVSETTSKFLFRIRDDANYDIPAGIPVYPNVDMFSSSSNTGAYTNPGDGDFNNFRIFTLPPEDLTINGNTILQAGVRVRPNTGADGDVVMKGNLTLGTSPGGNNGRIGSLQFQNSGTARTFTVEGNILVRNGGWDDGDNDGNLDYSTIEVLDGGSASLEHRLVAEGNITLEDQGRIDLVGSDAVAILELAGETNAVFSQDGTSATPQLYRIDMNKGVDTTSTFSLDDDVILNAPLTAQPQAIDMNAGKLIVNDPALDITLADNSVFLIRSGTGIEVTQGTARTRNDAVVNLNGLLRINGPTVLVRLADSDIEYSNTGEALIDVLDGSLRVGHQIRRPTTTSTGILKYRQSGGIVRIGEDDQSENVRAMFEVLNEGSEFTHTGGAFTIIRGVTGDNNPSLTLEPEVFEVSGSTITLGNSSTPSVANSNFFNIKSAIELENITIFDELNFPPVRAFSLPITTNGLFEIQANAEFRANGFDITINGDLDNEGTYLNSTALTSFGNAVSQTLSGAGSFSFFDLTKTNNGIFSVQSDITVSNDLRIEQGSVDLTTSVLDLRGDAFIETTLTNDPGGYLSFNSDFNNQNLYGLANNTITLGKIQIDNPNGVDIIDGFGYNFDITEELALLEGVFNIGGSLTTIREGASITGDLGGTAFANFSINNMVQTNSSFVDNGLRIEFFDVASDTTIIFPIGEQAYTPVTFDLTAGSEAGSLRIRPANERHPTIVNNVEPNAASMPPVMPAEPDLDDITNVLQYYWVVVADGIDMGGLTGAADFYYEPSSITLDNSPDPMDPTNINGGTTSFTVADYISARLLSGGTLWDKFAPIDFDEANNRFSIDFAGALSAAITGDYTAGVGNSGNNTNATTTNIEGAIPDEIVEYISINTGSYGDDANWSPDPGTGIGPVGGRVTISAGDEITLDLNNVRLYETIIDQGGTIIVNQVNFGHRLGNVTGQGTIQLQGTGDLPAGEYSSFFDCAGGALDYSGSGSYSVLGSISQLRKVSFTGTGTRLMPSNILEVCDTLNINGPSLTMNTGQTITVGEIGTPNDLFWVEAGTVGLTNSTVLDVNGSVAFDGGSFTGSSGTSMFIFENMIRPSTGATLDWNNTAVTLDGSAAQVISGNFQSTRSFDDLTINNSSATGVTILGDIDIEGQLTYSDGYFYTSAQDTLRMRSSLIALGAGAASHVKGPMVKNNIAASSSYTFPIGKSNRYAPVRVVNVGTGADNWKAEYFTSNLRGVGSFDTADPGSGYGALVEISDDMWRVQSEGSNTAQVRLQIGPWHNSQNNANLRVAWWDQAQSRWENQGGNPITGNNTNGTVRSENTISFSTQDFTLGGVSDDALPVEMLYLRATEDKGRVNVEWATSTEIDNEYFEVQRSQDGKDWEVIGVVDGSGTTTVVQYYDFTDDKPYVGLSYYRLRQIDYDGKFAFTDIVAANVALEPLIFSVYPNPAVDFFNIEITGISANEEASYKLVTLQGGIADSGSLRADEGGRINEQVSFSYGQPAGIYIMMVETSRKVLRFTLIKK